MNVSASPVAIRCFARILAARRVILVMFLLLGALGIYGATRIPDDNAIGSLSVADDPNARATAAFDARHTEWAADPLYWACPTPLTSER